MRIDRPSSSKEQHQIGWAHPVTTGSACTTATRIHATKAKSKEIQ